MIFSTTVKNAMLNGLANRLNGGTAAVSIRQGASELVSLPLANPIQSSIFGNKLTFAAIEQQLVVLSGTPDGAVITLNGATEIELVVGVDLILSKNTLQAGGYFKIDALSITL